MRQRARKGTADYFIEPVTRYSTAQCTIASGYYRRHSKVVTDAARDSGVPLGVDGLSLAAVAHANRSPYLLRVGLATKITFISRQERKIEEFNPLPRTLPIFLSSDA